VLREHTEPSRTIGKLWRTVFFKRYGTFRYDKVRRVWLNLKIILN